MTDLNAGSGVHYIEHWLNLDIDPQHKTDIVADLAEMPFADGTMNRVFATHVLEHLEYRNKLPAVLAEIHRVLEDDGELCVVGPDIERAVLLGEQSRLLQMIVAWSAEFYAGAIPDLKRPPEGHAWTSTALLTELALEAAGFTWIPYNGHLHKIAGLGWPLESFAAWQHGYICRKATAS